MFEAFIKTLIIIAVLMLCYFGLFDWFFPAVGVMIPGRIQTIALVIFVLIAVLVLARFLWPMLNATWNKGG